MCDFCRDFNFGRVGLIIRGKETTVYFPSMVGAVPNNEKFKFCPNCGKKLTEENFKNREERNNEQDVE